MSKKAYCSATGSVSHASSIALLVILVVSSLAFPTITQAASGDEAPNSTITLQMPFISGETWIVGGLSQGYGYFYGQGDHTNANDDYYATDWNRAGDNGATVLPVADGVVSAVQTPPCPTSHYGCFVQIDHSSGYRTLYGHLQSVFVVNGATVHTWTAIGLVGNTGNSSGSHLHLRFAQNNGGYNSYCGTGVPPNNLCPNGEVPHAPQGYKPSPMMTTLGSTTLQDGTWYTSVNGRNFVDDLRNNENGDGRVSRFYVLNNGPYYRAVTISYFDAYGNPTAKGTDTCGLNPGVVCWIYVDELNRVSSGGYASAYIDGGEDVLVAHILSSTSNIDMDNSNYPGAIGDPEFDRASTKLYTPAVYDNIYGWSPTSFQVMNTGLSTASVTFTFYGRAGYADYGPFTVYVQPKGEIYLSTDIYANQPWIGSVVWTSNQAISVKAVNTYSNGSTATYEAAAQGANTVYIPPAYKTNYNITTGIIAQNVGTQNTTVDLRFYDRSGAQTTTYPLGSIGPQRANGVQLSNVAGLPDNWAGSVWVVSTSSPAQPLIVVSRADQSSSGSYYFHSASSSPSGLVILPNMAKNNGGETSQYIVQNTSSAGSCTVTAYYYSQGGGEVTSQRETYTLAPYASAGRNQANDAYLGDGWWGYIKLQSSCGTLAAIPRGSLGNGSIAAYNGIAH